MKWRLAAESDLDLLAEWNHQLIADEGHRNQMTQAELQERMRDWLAKEYVAVIFTVDGDLAYALFRESEDEVYLRQFFVRRDRRRGGIGSTAMGILLAEVWPKGKRLRVDVLVANEAAIAFWRSVAYEDYCLTLEMSSNSE